ncbi:hypothetical protein M0811_03243 [Anaeramoeba ignava]|uniref:Uncharacterized protein n=1 Tax=Anaeramoeba ignava TaxID=1746090 RepID=A0A9Q0R5M0_ANAIG|nr:hypothetical protein M0811_03243 [Anaeramoeba ignava]
MSQVHLLLTFGAKRSDKFYLVHYYPLYHLFNQEGFPVYPPKKKELEIEYFRNLISMLKQLLNSQFLSQSFTWEHFIRLLAKNSLKNRFFPGITQR